VWWWLQPFSSLMVNTWTVELIWVNILTSVCEWKKLVIFNEYYEHRKVGEREGLYMWGEVQDLIVRFQFCLCKKQVSLLLCFPIPIYDMHNCHLQSYGDDIATKNKIFWKQRFNFCHCQCIVQKSNCFKDNVNLFGEIN